MSLWGFIWAFLWHGQSYLVYPAAFWPRPRHVDDPSSSGIPYEDIELRTSDNIALRCYLMLYEAWRAKRKNETATPGSHSRKEQKTTTARATLIIFHGNAMDHGGIIPVASQFLARRCNVLTVSYRGYGYSSGSPSECGLQIDAQTAFDYVSAHPKLSNVPIIIYGQSLGGAVAIDVTSKNSSKIRALIVENTFTSVPDLVRDLPYIGVFHWLCTQRWSSASKIPKIQSDVPILMLSGAMDQVVPREHMDALHKLALQRDIPTESNANEPDAETKKRNPFKSFPYGDHASTWTTVEYWETIHRFLRGLDTIPNHTELIGSHSSTEPSS